MPLLHVLVLAITQGITEFLPISSSGHLVLIWEGVDFFGWPAPEQSPSDRLLLDIAVHVGTLAAVCLYFWRDIVQMLVGLAKLLTLQGGPGARLAFHIIVASIPLGIVGFLFRDVITAYMHNITVVAWATIGFAILLLAADRLGMTVNRIEHLTVVRALIVGLAQVLALVPGTSRAGITMTAARFLGFERTEAARFSLLMAIPAIIGPGALAGAEFYQTGSATMGFDALAAAGISFLVALVAIAFLLRWLSHAGFMPFVVYRLLLGTAILVWLA